MTTTHPTPDDLRAFALGILDTAAAAAIEAHLAGCPDCVAHAADTPADRFADLLRAAELPVDTPPTFAATLAWGPAGAGPPAPPDLAAHPRYRVVRPLGAGGMGSVWLAEHAVMDRPVALKVIRAEFLAQPGAAERFAREVRAAAKLGHPNIVAAYDADRVGDTHFLVMEYVDGRTLADALAAGPVPVADACRYARDAARGLAHAHAHGLVHRDVKPHNLMLAADGMVKVLDFGLAAFTGAASGLTGTNVVAGTPDYIAPEQAEDARTADARSDVYSLGCTLYHLLAGRVPFPGDSVLKKLDAHRSRDPEPLIGAPAGLAAVVAKMMAKSPADRYQTAAEVAVALEPFCGGATVPGTAPGAGPGQKRLSRGWLVTAGLLAAAAAAAAGVAVVIRDRNGKEVGRANVPDGGSVAIEPARPAAAPAAGPVPVRPPFPIVEPAVIHPAHTIAWPDAGGFNDCEVSPDGRYVLAVALGAKLVRVWDATAASDIPRREWRDVLAAGFTPDGKYVLACGRGRRDRLRYLNVETGETDRVVEFGSWTSDFELSADGTRLLRTYVNGPESGCDVWDLTRGARLNEFPYASADGDAVKLTADGRFLVRQPGGRPPADVYDVTTGQPTAALARLRDVPPLGNWWSALSPFSADGRRVLAGDGRGRAVLDAATGAPVSAVPDVAGGWAILTADGRRVFGPAVERNACGVWDADTGRRTATLKLPDTEVLDDRGWCRVSRDGSVALLCLPSGNVYIFRGPGMTPAAPTPPAGPKLLQKFGRGDSVLFDLEFSFDGAQVTANADNGRVARYELATGRTVWSVALPAGAYTMKAPPGGRPLVLWGKDGVTRTINPDSGEVAPAAARADPPVLIAVPVPDADGGHAVAVHGTDFHKPAHSVRVWNWRDGRELLRLPGAEKHLGPGLAIAPGGTPVATTGTDGAVRLWHITTGRHLHTLAGHQGTVYCVAFTPDGKHLVSGGADKEIRVWDVAKRSQVGVLTGHRNYVFVLAVTPDGTRVLSTGSGEGLRVWDLKAGELLHHYAEPAGIINQILVTPDSTTAVTASDDGFVRTWRLPPPKP